MTGNRCKARRGGSVKQIQRHLHDRYSDICTSAVFGRGRGFGVILASRILLKNKHLKGKEKERNKKTFKESITPQLPTNFISISIGTPISCNTFVCPRFNSLNNSFYHNCKNSLPLSRSAQTHEFLIYAMFM